MNTSPTSSYGESGKHPQDTQHNGTQHNGIGHNDTTLSLKGFFATLSINDTRTKWHITQKHIVSSAIMLSVANKPRSLPFKWSTINVFTSVGSSLTGKVKTRVHMNSNDKHSSLLRYCSKMLHCTFPISNILPFYLKLSQKVL